jgi:hypothetical protein
VNNVESVCSWFACHDPYPALRIHVCLLIHKTVMLVMLGFTWLGYVGLVMLVMLGLAMLGLGNVGVQRTFLSKFLRTFPKCL